MAKKTFKGNNPALQFISAVTDEAPEPATPTAASPQAAPAQRAQASPQQASAQAPAGGAGEAPAAAAQHRVPAAQAAPIAPQTPAAVRESTSPPDEKSKKRFTPSSVPAPVRVKAAAVSPADERKSRRLNLLLQPSVMDDIAKIAHMRKTSVNDLVNSVLRDFSLENYDVVARYDEIFGGIDW